MSALLRFAGGRRGLVVLLAVCAVAASSGPLVLVWLGSRSGAEFAATKVVGINRLSSATVDIETGPAGVAEATGATAAIIATNFAPGDRKVGAIEVRNAGSVALRWSVQAERNADPLAAALRWELWPAVDRADCAAAAGGAGAAGAGAVGGAGPAIALAGSGGRVALLGDAEPGPDPGDQELPVGGRAAVCVAATLPIDATDVLQGRAFEQVFVIAAEQAALVPAGEGAR
ncbi:MAG: hypothetical protein IT196_27565 [Acidimicrobiales bacterium]|nr:hypothetical protein [Acidimicrobiales bacterium]